MPKSLGIGLSNTLGSRGKAASFASSPAPAGYHWEFVTFQGIGVTFNSVPVVALVSN